MLTVYGSDRRIPSGVKNELSAARAPAHEPRSAAPPSKSQPTKEIVAVVQTSKTTCVHGTRRRAGGAGARTGGSVERAGSERVGKGCRDMPLAV